MSSIRQGSKCGPIGGDMDVISHLQCTFCLFHCKTNGTLQIHMGTHHPLHCEEMPVGRLGKAIFYQRTARLFHCQVCFYTARTFARVFDHLVASHCFTGGKASRGDAESDGDVKEELSDSGDSKDGLEAEKVKGQSTEPGEEVKGLEDPGLDGKGKEEAPEGRGALKRKRGSGSGSEEEEADEGEEEVAPSGGDTRGAAEVEEAKVLAEFVERQRGRYYCKLCRWRTKLKGIMLHHVSMKHEVPKPHSCPECSKNFLLKSIMLSHVALQHRRGLYLCPYCSFRSNVLRGLRRHLNHCSSKQEGEDVKQQEASGEPRAAQM
ncbi:chromosome alignment-maintaining phosphoprotein 1-like [Denticeps clupeoides]|uniref:chromosome alignment-maintaining phosphoprotein 1-like n=1 Tax=Denticeps clupeoides TaxID=299321 RepID=UPI0010A48F07|nr:chromosome alignment-maintaining phosphoprotein 1-like [Denticeps clupeoides]